METRLLVGHTWAEGQEVIVNGQEESLGGDGNVLKLDCFKKKKKLDCFDSFPTLQTCLKKKNIELYTYHEMLFWSINGVSQKLFKNNNNQVNLGMLSLRCLGGMKRERLSKQVVMRPEA